MRVFKELNRTDEKQKKQKNGAGRQMLFRKEGNYERE